MHDANLIEQRRTNQLLEALIELQGGTPPGPTTRLLPNTVYFIPPEFNWAPDAAVTNGTQVGDGFFKIRTDAGLAPNEVPCNIDVQFDTFPSFEGAIQGAAPSGTPVS